MKPTPIWERWKKDPKKRERMFRVLFFLMIGVNVMIVVGFLIFIYLLLKRV